MLFTSNWQGCRGPVPVRGQAGHASRVQLTLKLRSALHPWGDKLRWHRREGNTTLVKSDLAVYNQSGYLQIAGLRDSEQWEEQWPLARKIRSAVALSWSSPYVKTAIHLLDPLLFLILAQGE